MELLEYEHRTAFHHSLWSRFQWLELLGWSKFLRLVHGRHLDEHEYSAIQDAFYALEGEMPNTSPAGQAWGKVINSDVFPKLDAMITDKTSQVNVLLFLAKKYYEMLNQKEEKEEDKEEEQNQSCQQPSQQPGKNPSPPAEITQEDIAEALNQLGNSEEGEGEVQPDPQAGPADMQLSPEDIREMKFSVSEEELEELKEQIEGEQQLANLVAGTGSSPVQERQFVEINFEKYTMKRMAKLIGWGQKVVEGAVRQNKGAIGEFSSVTKGGWTSNVTTMDQHLVSSGHGLGVAKMAESKLNNRVHKEEQPSGKGSVVFLHDESGSMEDTYRKISHIFRNIAPENRTEYQKNLLEKNPPKDLQAINLQLALAALFRKENRPFTAIAWDSDKTRVYKYGKPGLENHLRQFLSGGTEVTHALLKAFEIIQEDPQHRNNADIILATDGDTSDSPLYDPTYIQEAEKFRKNGGRVWGIFIGNADPSSIERMSTYCDAVISIEDLYTNDKLAEILRNAATSTQKHKKRMIT